jgi:hypothetical protein
MERPRFTPIGESRGARGAAPRQKLSMAFAWALYFGIDRQAQNLRSRIKAVGFAARASVSSATP